MGDTIWIQIKDGDKIDCNMRDHSVLLDLTEALDVLAAKLGVQPLSSYYDFSAMEGDYAMDEEDSSEEDPVDIPAEDQEWFDPGEALTSTRTILAALEKGEEIPGYGKGVINELIEDLKGCENELSRAQVGGLLFNFTIVM